MMYDWSNDLPGVLMEKFLTSRPYALAQIRGDRKHPDIVGTVSFHNINNGTVVICEFTGLPYQAGYCGGGVLGLHIHAGERCIGNEQDPFAGAGTHYNPAGCAHPFHAGDLLPIFVNGGYAWSAFYTERFDLYEIVGKTVILHDQPDDFKTQPAGNSGAKIACGVIVRA